jgi:serine/threonine protein kinase
MWEIFAGGHPFDSFDPTDLIYCHLARDIEDPRERNFNIPEHLSKLILKLVKKDPAERYQLASAVRSDLSDILDRIALSRAELKMAPSEQLPMEEILNALHEWNWDLGSRDYSPFLSFPNKPQGRHDAAQQLLDSFTQWNQCNSQDRAGMIVCLSGDAGAGKKEFGMYLTSFATTLGSFSGNFFYQTLIQ